MHNAPAATVTEMPDQTSAETLFRSTLGERAKKTPPPTLPIYGLPRMSTIEEEAMYYKEPVVPVRGLESQLYLYSVTSLFTSLLYFLRNSFDETSFGAFLPSWPLLALTAYVSLLLTFRCGVKRIALSVDDETPVRAIDLGVDEDELLLPPIDDEVDQCHLSGVKSVVVQGLTLLAAAALMHLPVHSMRGLPVEILFAAWLTSTCLVGLLMWDAITSAAKAERDERPEELTLVSGYITKA